MPAFQIVIDRRQQRASSRSPAALEGVVDVLVDGTNVTARIGQDLALPLLRDLAMVAAQLASGSATRATVRFYDQKDAWALGLERSGDQVLLTVFRAGPFPQVAVYERPVRGDALLRGIRQALDEVLDREGAPEPVAGDLALSRERLAALAWEPGVAPRALAQVRVDGPEDAPIRFSAEVAVRTGVSDPGAGSELERNDLHSLLARGAFRVHVAGFSREIGDTFVFLVAEMLVQEARALLESWELSHAHHRRTETAGVFMTVRLTTDGALTVTFGGPRTGGLRNALSFPALSVPQFVQAVVVLGRGVSHALLRHDHSQLSNLRLRAMREQVRALAVQLREAVRDDAKVNEAPESYRAFAEAVAGAGAGASGAQPWGHARIRFVQAWQGAVPAIDLQSTFIFGDRIVVGGARELAGIDRATGKLLWRVPIERGVSVATPAGVARLSPDGTVALHDLETGEVATKLRLAARVGGAPAGAVVSAPGLPRLLVVSEGERHITAIDLVSGEVRWRHGLGRGRSFKVRRAGRLLVVSSCEPTLTAIDAASGETVWRARDRLRFCRPAAYDNNALFVVAGDSSPRLRTAEALLCLDPWTGLVRWRRELPAGARAVGAPSPAQQAVVVALHDPRGTGFAAFDRGDGALGWRIDPGFAPATSAWLVVDETLVVNGASGAVSAIDLSRGGCRWQHRFERGGDADVPRHLDPLLRSGALFVPQHKVHVLRPNDGDELGQVPSDLVPDLVRVDERCNVVVVEDSGHLAAFQAGARLTLVKG